MKFQRDATLLYGYHKHYFHFSFSIHEVKLFLTELSQAWRLTLTWVKKITNIWHTLCCLACDSNKYVKRKGDEPKQLWNKQNYMKHTLLNHVLTESFHFIQRQSSSWVRWASFPRAFILMGSSFWYLQQVNILQTEKCYNFLALLKLVAPRTNRP